MLKCLFAAGISLAAVPIAIADPGTMDPPAQEPEIIDPALLEPIQIIKTVTMDDLRLMLDEVGATFIAAGRTGDGAPFVFGEFEDGLTFGAYAVCAMPDGSDCRGLEFMAVYGSTVSEQVIAGIDRDYPAISLYKSDAQKVRVSRYVILDHGIAWDNMIENMNVFRTLCGKVSERLANLADTQANAEWK